MSKNISNSLSVSAVAHEFADLALGYQSPFPFNCLMKVEVGEEKLLLTIHNGTVTKISNINDLAPLPSWDFSVSSSLSTWLQFWQETPKPGYSDLFALTRYSRMTIEGDLLLFMQHLQFFKDLLALGRGRLA